MPGETTQLKSEETEGLPQSPGADSTDCSSAEESEGPESEGPGLGGPSAKGAQRPAVRAPGDLCTHPSRTGLKWNSMTGLDGVKLHYYVTECAPGEDNTPPRVRCEAKHSIRERLAIIKEGDEAVPLAIGDAVRSTNGKTGGARLEKPARPAVAEEYTTDVDAAALYAGFCHCGHAFVSTVFSGAPAVMVLLMCIQFNFVVALLVATANCVLLASHETMQERALLRNAFAGPGGQVVVPLALAQRVLKAQSAR
jgi:hypothetical protein